MLKRLNQSTIILMLVIVIGKLIGMFRDVVLANYFGTSNVSDAYLIAVSVPTLIFYFIGHALSTAYLPMYNNVKRKSGVKAALAYSNQLMCVAMLLCAVLVVALILFPLYIVKLFAAGFDDDTLQLSATFVKYSACSLFFMAALNIFSGYLQANGNFLLPAMVSVPRNFAIVISIVIAANFSITFLGTGLLFAYVAELCLLLPAAIKAGYKLYLKSDSKSAEMRETVYIVLPITIGVGVSQINKIIDKSIASTVAVGGISALSYASIINNAIQEILVTGIITILFANCAAWVAEGKNHIVKEKLSETIQTLSFLLIPASFGVVAVSQLIVKCILSRGAFDEESVTFTAGALCCYTVGLCFLAVRDTLIKVFYAYKDTQSTAATSIFAITLNIVLNLILSKFWGINGLAIATSIAAIIQCMILYIILRQKIGDFGLSIQLISAVKILGASILMFMGVKLIVAFVANLGAGDIQQLVIGIGSGGILYTLCVILFKVPVALRWVNSGLKKLHN